MDYHVVEAKYVEGYRISVAFRDGRAGIVDLERELVGLVLEPIRVPCDVQTLHHPPRVPDPRLAEWRGYRPEALYERARQAA